MTRFIASTLFKDKDGEIQPLLLKYNSGDSPLEVSFETVKRYIEEYEGLSYHAGRPIPLHSDARYIEVYSNIDSDKDYTFLFSTRDPDKFKKPIPRSKS